MPIPKDMPSITRVSGGGIQKVTRTGKCGSAQTMPPSSAAAITSHHNWAHIASGVSSASSEQNEASFSGQSLTRASSNQSLSLACPYAELSSVVIMQSFDVGRLHCWSKSYPSIPRLKYAKSRLELPSDHLSANDTLRSAIGNTCIAFIACQNSFAADVSRSSLRRNYWTPTVVECQCVIQAKPSVLKR
jgi:hypothetical protein